jgi:hypothetical protein
MSQTISHFSTCRSLGIFCAVLAACSLPAAAEVTSVTKNADAVGKYTKLELTVGLSDTYANPYDPEQIDLSAEFTAPSKKVWKVNGYYDGTAYKVRFAGNEVGDWSYVVTAKDAKGTAASQAGTFACKDSPLHGWVHVAPNKRYLQCDDGASFYGVGSCHAWSVSTQTLDQMKALGFNTYVYWNGTYDSGGGNQLIESMASGIGKYDQRKCSRLDDLMNWNEARNMGMILVILPHDWGCEKVGGWPAKWTQSPYKDIVSSDKYYTDEKSWAYQQKQYRYIIARWGYSTGIVGWQTVDEISGTNGWVADQAGANKWTENIGKFFQNNDPFKHPTTASHGSFWDEGNKANDMPNTEIYGDYTPPNITAVVQKLWNGYEKPCIMGETGADRDGAVSHGKIWSGLAAGIAITPLLWQFNQGWNASISAQYPAFNKFIADINFAGLKNPAQAKVSIPGTNPMVVAARGRGGARGPATASAPASRGAPAASAPSNVAGVWGITSDQLTFGWMTGAIAGKSLKVTGLANGGYKMEWWDCANGTVLSTKNVTVADGALTAEIPATTQADLAFKIIAAGK